MTVTARRMDELLEVITLRAPKLREAGVTSLEVDGVSIELAPPPPIFTMPRPTEASEHDPAIVHAVSEWPEDEEDRMDPLVDPDTYGGAVPSFLPPDFKAT